MNFFKKTASKNRVFFWVLLLLSFCFIAWNVLADASWLYPDELTGSWDLNSKYIGNLPGVWGENSLEENFMPAVMKFITWSVGGVAAIVMLYSGVRMITSAGDSEAREDAKKMLYWAILGIIFIVLAYAIVRGITSLQFNQTPWS